MSATIVSLIAFAAMFGGAILGMGVRVLLPPHHLSSPSRDVVRLCIAILATVSSLVIGLLIASAKSSFDERTSSVRHFVAEALLVDRAMARLGSGTSPARKQFRDFLQTRLQEILNEEAIPAGASAISSKGPSIETVEASLLDLPDSTDAQRILKDRALSQLNDIAQTRWLLVEEAGGSIQPPFIVILIAWLAVIFASFGLFSPRNATVLVIMGISAASIAGSLFLILEMDQPYDGMIRLSERSIEIVLQQLGEP
jgi:hypothetical protein